MGGGVGGRGMKGAGSSSTLSTVSVSPSGSGFGSCLWGINEIASKFSRKEILSSGRSASFKICLFY